MALDYLPSPGWAVIYGETPSATRWSELGDNDDALATGVGIDDLAILNRHLALSSVKANNLDASAFNRFRAVKTASQTMSGAAGTFQKVTYPVSVTANAAYSIASSTFTAPAAGVYFFIAGAQCLQATPGNVDDAIGIYKNGALLTRGSNFNGIAYPSFVVIDCIPLAAGDTVEIYYRSKTTSTQIEGNSVTAYLTGVRLV